MAHDYRSAPAIPSAVAWSPVSSTPFRSHRLIVSPLERVEATCGNLDRVRVGMGDVTKAGQLGDGSDNRRVCPETGVQLFDQDAGARPPVGLAKELQDLLGDL